VKFSPKQIDYLTTSNHDFNISTGAIRSGKTYVQIIRLIHFIWKDAVRGESILVIGRTLSSIRRNFYNDLWKMIEANEDVSLWEKKLAPDLEIKFKPLDISLVFVGANDESAESKIRGMTCQAVFGDEVTLWPRNILTQCIGRASAGPRYKFFTCNPDRPTHYFRTEIIMNSDLNLGLWNFTLDDNPSLAPEYIETIKNSFTGVMYDRMILGKWVAVVEGAVFHAWDRKINLVDKRRPYHNGAETIICWDFGVSDPTAIIAFQVFQVDKTADNTRGLKIYVINEYQNHSKDAAHYADVVNGWGYVDPTHYGDPSGGARESDLSSWVARLKLHDIHIRFPRRYSIAEHVNNANLFLPYFKINEQQNPLFVEMIENWSYPLDKDGRVKEGEKPEHNEYSHLGTALYYGISGRFPHRGPFKIVVQ